jgi:CheY-like chemotaxis protein
MILDLVMPVLDGFEVLRRLRDDSSFPRVPVFVLTGKDLSHAESATLERQIESLFRKSEAWKDDLLREIRNAVRWSGHSA